MLSMAFFGQLVADWAGGPQHVAAPRRALQGRHLPRRRVTVGGEVIARDEAAGTVELKLLARKQDGTVTLEGSATVRL